MSFLAQQARQLSGEGLQRAEIISKLESEGHAREDIVAAISDASVPLDMETVPSGGIGDAEGEHLYVQRGQYGAWLYVVLGFLISTLFWSGTLGGLLLVLKLHAEWLTLAVGAVVSFFVFRDRWRVNEAFTSRYLSGLMNLSLLYAPVVSFVYAHVRGVKKFSGR
jgi:hypothetical protein